MSRTITTDADRRRARRNILLGVCMGVVVLLLGTVLYVLVGYLRVTAIPPPPPEARFAGDVTAFRGSAPTSTLDAQLEQVEQAAREGRHGQFAIGLRPEDLQASLVERLKDQRIEGLKVYFGEGVVILQGKAPVAERRLWATVRVRPRVEDGQLLLAVDDAMLGTQPMWARVRQELQREIDKALANQAPDQTGVWLDSVAISPYGMTVQGHTQARQQR